MGMLSLSSTNQDKINTASRDLNQIRKTLIIREQRETLKELFLSEQIDLVEYKKKLAKIGKDIGII